MNRKACKPPARRKKDPDLKEGAREENTGASGAPGFSLTVGKGAGGNADSKRPQ